MSRRAAIWGAAVLTVAFALLFSMVLLQPVLGSNGDTNNDGVITVDSISDVPGATDGWEDDDDDDDHDDEHEDDDD